MKKAFSRMSLAALGLLATGNSALAYEASTHGVLSGLAFDGSRLADPMLLSDIGFSSTGQYRSVSVDGFPRLLQTPRQLVALGAIVEDAHDICLSGWMRVFNHFFDPQHGGRALELGILTLGHPSPDWALEDNGQVSTIPAQCFAAGGRPQNFSYRDAQGNLYLAFTQQNASDRDNSMGLVLQTLGHVVHHLQDMAQPAHTRNEAHSPINPPERAWIEGYTEDFINDSVPTIVSNNPYPVPNFARARDYWVTSGASAPTYVGMAEYTSQNFISQSTGFGSSGNTVLPNPDFPLPNGQGKTIGQTYATINLHDGSTVSGPISVVTGPIFDGYAFGSQPNKVLAAQSLLDRLLQQSGHSKLFGVNSYVYRNQYPVLLPRAVGFSAGLINHFFAGKLGVSRVSSGSGWTIRNDAVEAMTGQFELYYQTANGQRLPVPGATPWVGTLASGQSTPALPEPPSTASKVIAVFFGTIGSESIPRAAGRVTDYAAPPVACAGSKTNSGGSSGLEYVHDLGTSSGQVQLEFEAYGIPDAVTMWSENSARTRLVRSDGQVSGFHQYTYSFNPAALGSTKVRVRVDGNTDTGTMWVATLGCPGQNLGNGQRGDYPRVTVNFNFGQPLSGAMGTCDADFYVNGVRIGGVHVGASGGSSLSPTLTKGLAHHAEFRNFRCSSDNRNILVGASYVDPAGHTHVIQNWNVLGVTPFNVH